MQQTSDPLEIASVGIVRVTVRTDEIAGLMAPEMATTGTGNLHLAGFRHSDALEQSLVGLVLWHGCNPQKNLNHPDIGLSRT